MDMFVILVLIHDAIVVDDTLDIHKCLMKKMI